MPTPTPDATSDTKAPSVLSLQFSPPTVRDGSEALLLAQIVDDLSGVQHANGVLTSPNGKASVGFSFQRQGESERYAARLAIPKDAEAGEWYISWLNLGDSANNTASLGYSAATAPPGWRLVVESSEPDATPPTVRAVWLDRQAVPEKESVKVFVQADDDASGVASVSGIFQSPSKKALLGFAGQLNAEANAWLGTVAIPAGADCGDWTLVSLHLADKARNVVTVPGTDPALQRASFTVTRSGACDSEPPVLQAISLSPQAVSNEQPAVVEVTALVSDDVTGTRGVSGRVEGPPPGGGAPTPRIHFSCARSSADPSAPWTGRITVPRFSASGTWRVTWLQTQDAAGNSRVYSTSDAVLAPALFEVR